jgi:hypothetical protein
MPSRFGKGRGPHMHSISPIVGGRQGEWKYKHVQVSCERAAESHIHVSDMKAIRDGRPGCAGYTLKCKVN